MSTTSPEATWMTDLSGTPLADIPLSTLYIPGSHDSGTYQMNTDLGFAPDIADSPLWVLNTLWFITSNLFLRYSVTQKMSVFAQLTSGVRYLDLRVAKRPEDSELYIVHSFYGPHLARIITDVSIFLQQNPKEVVVLDFQHVHNFDKESLEDHTLLINMLIDTFGKKLVPAEANFYTTSLSKLWEKGHQVFLFYRPYENYLCSNLLWPSQRLPNPWGDVRDPEELKKFLARVLSSRSDQKLFVTQAVLTPDPKYVALHPFGNLNDLVIQANSLLAELLKKEEEEKFNRKAVANIIMFDFVGWESGKPLPAAIIGLNRRRMEEKKLK